MRILMFTTPLLGHFLPMLPLAREFRKQGHVVAFASAAPMASAVESEGLDLIAVGPDKVEMLTEAIKRIGAEGLTSESPQFVAEFFAGVRLDLGADDALVAARSWAPDMIVSERCDFLGPMVAATLKLPSAVIATDPALEPDLLEALATSVGSRFLVRGLEAPVDALSGRWLLDLCPPSLHGAAEVPGVERKVLRPEPHQAPEGVPPVKRAALTGRPRVLVSFSTGSNEMERLGSLLRSLSTLDVDLVATTSGNPAPPEGFGLDPDRLELVVFVPAAELLDGVSVVVHHGGSGTTFGAAARGIPAVVVPDRPTQQGWAQRLEAAGAGLVLPVGDQVSPEEVAAAVERLLSDPGFTVAAQRLRDEIAAMPTPAEVAAQLVAAAG
ncbi:glycosyltransferase [Streptomyces sp. NBC_00178]|uniref:glycosyltransferase n=1 Tax=Streptomyces sp. NBC_00178 TaxID=2975672 RepID=UPI002E2C6DCA|nr:glycosyltransferase [Streptomyces sp. NBC_00178]